MKGGTVKLSGVPAITAAPALAAEAELLELDLSPRFGGTRDATVSLKLEIGSVDGQPSPEAYELTVDASGIRIVGNSGAGVFYGLQSFLSLFPPEVSPSKSAVLPAVRVVDAPRFGYRGLHLDVARNFQPKADGAARARPDGALQAQRPALPPHRR